MKFSSSIVALAFATQALAFSPAKAPRSSTALNGVLEKTTGQSSMDPAVISRYNDLPFPADTILAEYVWVDAKGDTRSKTRTLPASKAEKVETWP